MTLSCPPRTVVRCLALTLALHAAQAYGLEPLNPPAKASAPADVARRVDELLARAVKGNAHRVRQPGPGGGACPAVGPPPGINDECPPVNYFTVHFGNQVEIAATTSRVFLGVELQCAQCHDAKNEPWKREQFHEFVAFF